MKEVSLFLCHIQRGPFDRHMGARFEPATLIVFAHRRLQQGAVEASAHDVVDVVEAHSLLTDLFHYLLFDLQTKLVRLLGATTLNCAAYIKNTPLP